ncbi:peptide-methionine (S)-S-oxide reductase MsrA [Loktanella sp. SALINAS62]|uniref:peptide-methionine (S)-S-oxide reductase MsrA n=1 Tax=Loktanella sp. SALINAS62 TaxID=2706124 RepID=UPI001B8C5962|nr:peptide-methionine (S)-S-oxide reductase MsrA [Loktanella sp. SALINAS62]MBS1302462.1 peptide-methionine (S)-S-oxide reductase MsrA [Loktanella sp. SALINAS62]
MKKKLIAAAILAIGFGNAATAQQTQTAIVAGGCFWCVEADFESVAGVGDVVSGYTGGTTTNPTYRQVTGGDTGHYEAVRIPFDPSVISYREIMDLFLRSIDPLDAGGQFCDRGDSYRTAIFVQTQEQANTATAAVNAAQQELGRQIVTPVVQAAPFYMAEDYHQDYYKSEGLKLTRGGVKTQEGAYKYYRDRCGRDQRVAQIWGNDAPFIN